MNYVLGSNNAMTLYILNTWGMTLDVAHSRYLGVACGVTMLEMTEIRERGR